MENKKNNVLLVLGLFFVIALVAEGFGVYIMTSNSFEGKLKDKDTEISKLEMEIKKRNMELNAKEAYIKNLQENK